MGRRRLAGPPSSECLAADWATARARQQIRRDALVALAELLTSRGFVTVFVGQRLCVRNLAADPADPPEVDPKAWALAPGLSQLIDCHPGPDGVPWFRWVWSDRVPPESADAGQGADDLGQDVEVQLLCRAAEHNNAADRIARVIATREDTDA